MCRNAHARKGFPAESGQSDGEDEAGVDPERDLIIRAEWGGGKHQWMTAARASMGLSGPTDGPSISQFNDEGTLPGCL